jgi:hypothetical protein
MIYAVGLVGGLCVFNLVLTFGVIRRLRELSDAAAHDVAVPVGQAVGDFAARTTNGDTVSRDSAQLVGFFSPGCQPCEECIPQFVDDPTERKLAVLVGDGSEAYAARLATAAAVVVEPPAGPVSQAFRVTSYPTLCLVDPGGVVLASGNSFRELRR